MARVAVNGLGRIGRATLKIVMDTPGLDLVAANDMGAPNSIAYLLNYDTVYGRYEKTVETTNDGTLTIGQHPLTLLREENPARLPWRALNVDIVFECTGAFTRRQDLAAHIRAGARYVILSAPSKGDGYEAREVRDIDRAHQRSCDRHERAARWCRPAVQREGGAQRAPQRGSRAPTRGAARRH